MPHRHATAGQASAEYVALLFLAALLLAVAGTAVARPSIAAAVAGSLRHAICVVAGGVCSVHEAEAAGLAPCPVWLRSNDERLGASVAVVHLERGDTLLIERRSDGSASVAFVDGGRLGGELAIGARLSLLPAGGSASAGLGVAFSAGRAWEFADWPAAQRFLRAFAAEETLTGEARGVLRRLCPICGLGGGDEQRRPDPDATFIEGGEYGELAGALRIAGIARGSLDYEGGTVVGRRRSGARTTWYLRMNAAASGRLGAVIAALHAAGSREALLEVSFEDGEPVELRATAGVTTATDLHLLGHVTGIGDVAAKLRLAGAQPGSNGGALEVSVTLDLRDIANREAVRALFRTGGPGPALAELARRLDAAGTVDLRTFALTGSERGADGQVGVGVHVGGGYARTETRRTLTGAWSLSPGGTVREREDCVDAAAALG